MPSIERGPVGLLERRDERIRALEADVERLQAILGELYVQRGQDVNTLRNAIRRAFRKANLSCDD